MQLVNMRVDRIIIHQIHRKDEYGNTVNPTQSHEYTRFDQDAMDTFKSRVNDALGEDSKAVQMDIADQRNNDLPFLIDTMIDECDAEFIQSSYALAIKLSKAQQRMSSIPGGILVIFTGTQGTNSKRFLGIIKAETHSGYEKHTNRYGEITLKFVEELLLTPGTRLYKTAGFFEKNVNNTASTTDLNDKWTVMVSDEQINKADGKVAAQYFYSGFLGCKYPESSARMTSKFYEETKKFIGGMDTDIAKKSNLFDALNTYLKADTASSINVATFSSRYFHDSNSQDLYEEHMRESGLSGSFTKDIEFIRNKLKHRNILFRHNIKITAPADKFKELITMESIEGDPDESGTPSEWTKIIIKDRVSKQE